MEQNSKNGDLLCPKCGGKLVWGGDFMANEVFSCSYEDDDEAISSNTDVANVEGFWRSQIQRSPNGTGNIRSIGIQILKTTHEQIIHFRDRRIQLKKTDHE